MFECIAAQYNKFVINGNPYYHTYGYGCIFCVR